MPQRNQKAADLTKYEHTVIEIASRAMNDGNDFSRLAMAKFSCEYATAIWDAIENKGTTDERS